MRRGRERGRHLSPRALGEVATGLRALGLVYLVAVGYGVARVVNGQPLEPGHVLPVLALGAVAVPWATHAWAGRVDREAVRRLGEARRPREEGGP